MPITRHHSGRWLFQFDRVIPGAGRQRANKLLPKGWSKAKAQEYDQRETARLYDVATGGRQPAPLIEDAVLLYLKDHAPDGKHPRKNYADLEGALALLLPFYAGRTTADLSLVVDEYTEGGLKEDEKTPLSKATIHNRLAYLRSACRYHWKNTGKKGPNPGDLMNLPSVSNERQVYLTRPQMLRALKRMGALELAKKRRYKDRDLYVARMAVRVAFYTGWRISEVLEATPVKIGAGMLALSIPDTKNGTPRIVPVHTRVEHVVRDHWPLPITKWTVSKKFKAALRAEDLGHARLHDVRHSAASEMINSDVDLYTVGGVLGHKSAASTRRYAHLQAAKLAGAVGKIGGRKSQPGGEKQAA